MTDPAARVRELRLALGLTQEELARRVGVSFVTVNRWEAGRTQPSAAALRRLETVGSVPSAFLTTFVGRRRELAELAAVTGRLVTLTGPGGLGKTRLADAWAPQAPALTLADSPVDAATVIVDVASVPAAQAIPLVRELLGRCQRVIVTSRLPLGLAGEEVWPTPPLSVQDSAELFTSRSGVTAGTALLEASGGLPFAVETLASWASSLTLDQVLARAASILEEPLLAAAVSQLAAGTADTLARLCIFAGGFTVDDAAAVTGLIDLDLVRDLRALVEAGWLQADPGVGSYRIAQPWRPVLMARLGARDELRKRHGLHVLSMASAAGRQLNPAARVRLEACAVDLELALQWAAEHDETTAGLEVSAALWPWWLSSGRISEGRQWIDGFLARTPVSDEPLLAQGWAAAAVLAAENGDHAAAVSLAGKASRVFQANGQLDQLAMSEAVLGSAHRYLGRRAQARTHFERSLALREQLGDRRGLATSLNNLALVALDDGDLARARQMLERSLAAKRLLDDPRSVAIGLCNLAHTLLKLELVADAVAALVEAAGIAEGLGDAQLTGTVAANLGDAQLASGSYEDARLAFEQAAGSYQEHPHDRIVALCGMARALNGLGRRHEALAVLRDAEGLALETGNEHRMNEVRATLALVDGVTLSPPPGSLTRRQAEILACLAEGGTNREIAERLHLSAGTVERHLASAYAKLGLRNRVEAARYALQHGLLPPAGH